MSKGTRFHAIILSCQNKEQNPRQYQLPILWNFTFKILILQNIDLELTRNIAEHRIPTRVHENNIPNSFSLYGPILQPFSKWTEKRQFLPMCTSATAPKSFTLTYLLLSDVPNSLSLKKTKPNQWLLNPLTYYTRI